MDAKKEDKIWEPIPSRRGPRNSQVGEINDRPLHMNPKIVAFQIRHDLLENSWIIRVENKHNPINIQEFCCKIKNEYYLIFPSTVLKGDLWEFGETKGTKIKKNKVHLVVMIDLHTSGKR
jgi:hypothetical protein